MQLDDVFQMELNATIWCYDVHKNHDWLCPEMGVSPKLIKEREKLIKGAWKYQIINYYLK